MGKPTGRVKARGRLKKLEDPLLNPEVVRLTDEFRKVRQEFLGDAVDAVVEMGSLLRRGQKLIAGHYYRWLAALEVDPTTASNYVRLAALKKENEDLVSDWKELGPSKLYRISQITPEGREAVLDESEHERLRRMNDQKFTALTAPYVAEPQVKVTAAMRAHGLRMKLQAWTQIVRKARLAGLRDGKIRRGLKGDVRALGAALRALGAKL